VVGMWATLALNITVNLVFALLKCQDFTRFTLKQSDQVWAQLIALPTATILYSFVGIIVTSAAFKLYNRVIWNPVELVAEFDNPVYAVIAAVIFFVVTLR
jgi:NCS1 family nucleobase:cation symporter-1